MPRYKASTHRGPERAATIASSLHRGINPHSADPIIVQGGRQELTRCGEARADGVEVELDELNSGAGNGRRSVGENDMGWVGRWD